MNSTKSSNPAASIIIDEDDLDDFPIPNSLKFMLDALKTISLNPLTTDNYIVWSSQIKSIFHANSYLHYLNPLNPKPAPTITSPDGKTSPNPLFRKWNFINRNLVVAIITTISPSIQPLIIQTETVADLWEALHLRFQSTSRSRILQLRDELHHLTMTGQTMTQYLNSIKLIADQLAAAGSPIHDDDIILYAINGLPPVYDGFTTALRLKTERIDLHTFSSLMLTEEITISRKLKAASQISNAALNSYKTRPQNDKFNFKGRGKTPNRNYGPNRNSSNQSNYKPNGVECQICHKIGHTADKCRYRHAQSSSQQNRPAATPSQQNRAAFLTETTHNNSFSENTSTPAAPDEWY